MIETVLFWVFGALILLCGLLTVTLKNLLHAAIALMGCLFTTGALFLLMHEEFIALMQVMVYIGGVVIFIVYAILLTTDLGERYLAPVRGRMAVAGMAAIALVVALVVVVMPAAIGEREAVASSTTIETIGIRLLDAGATGFLVPFEVISLLLLSALVGASVIARRGEDETAEKPQEGSA